MGGSVREWVVSVREWEGAQGSGWKHEGVGGSTREWVEA